MDQTNRRSGRLGNQSGQALAETAVSLVIIILMMLATVEFGRVFVITNAVTNAARVGARAAAMETSTNRDTSGFIVNKNPIINQVRSEVAAVVGTSLANSFQVQVTQPTGGLALARVSVTGTVPYVFKFLGTNFNVSRTVSYRDQGR